MRPGDDPWISCREEQIAGEAPNDAWLVQKTLLQRKNWSQISGTDFVFRKNAKEGVTLAELSDEMSLLDVIHMVIDVEYVYEIAELEPRAKDMLLALAHQAADSFAGRHPKLFI